MEICLGDDESPVYAFCGDFFPAASFVFTDSKKARIGRSYYYTNECFYHFNSVQVPD